MQWGLTLKGDLAMTISCSILGDRLSRTTVISWSPTTDGASASFYLVNCLVVLTLMMLNVTTASAAGAASGMTNNTAAMTNKAVFLIVDGIPADVIERVVTPNLDAIAKVGGYTRAEVGGPLNGPAETPTVSAPGYMSLVTGTWANKHNVYGNAGLTPNYDYWNLFRLAKSVEPPLQTGIFSTWTDNRTVLLGAGLANAGSVTIDFVADGFETDAQLFPHAPQDRHIQAIDRHVAAEAARVIEQAGPDLSWVYLQYTDDVGHARQPGDVAAVDAFVVRHAVDVEAQQVVGLSGHEVAGPQARATDDGGLEGVEQLDPLALEGDGHQHGLGSAHRVGVHDRPVADEDAVVLQPTDPTQACRRGQPDPIGQRLIAQPAVVLERTDDGFVHSIDHVRQIIRQIGRTTQ